MLCSCASFRARGVARTSSFACPAAAGAGAAALPFVAGSPLCRARPAEQARPSARKTPEPSPCRRWSRPSDQCSPSRRRARESSPRPRRAMESPSSPCPSPVPARPHRRFTKSPSCLEPPADDAAGHALPAAGITMLTAMLRCSKARSREGARRETKVDQCLAFAACLAAPFDELAA